MNIGLEELKQLADSHQRQKLIDRVLDEVCDYEERAVEQEKSAAACTALAATYRQQAREAQAMLDVLQNWTP